MRPSIFTLFLVLFFPQTIDAQIDFEKMRKQYEKRFAFLDTMSALPTDHGLPFEEIKVKVSDSISISAWFIPREDSKYTFLMVHGFMMNKSLMLSRARFFSDMGLSVLLMDLRARGSSTGNRTGGMGEGNAPDIEAIAQYYTNNYSDYGKLVAYGFSHGGRTLIHAASSVSFKKMILEGTPYSMAASLQRQLRLPDGPVFQEEDLDGALASISSLPILLLIGDNDTAIIPTEGEQLMKHTKAKKSQIIVFENTQHDVVIGENHVRIKEAISSFLKLKK